jgi:hypothetical protein
MSFILGFPEVIVPVLSRAIAVIVFIFSRELHHFIRTPDLAASPVQTITAVGVANPRAQGQAITITLQASNNAFSKLLPMIKYQTKKVRIERVITTGTNIFDMVSAKFSISDFCILASSKRVII